MTLGAVPEIKPHYGNEKPAQKQAKKKPCRVETAGQYGEKGDSVANSNTIGGCSPRGLSVAANDWRRQPQREAWGSAVWERWWWSSRRASMIHWRAIFHAVVCVAMFASLH